MRQKTYTWIGAPLACQTTAIETESCRSQPLPWRNVLGKDQSSEPTTQLTRKLRLRAVQVES
jgi:hypothetical protein